MGGLQGGADDDLPCGATLITGDRADRLFEQTLFSHSWLSSAPFAEWSGFLVTVGRPAAVFSKRVMVGCPARWTTNRWSSSRRQFVVQPLYSERVYTRRTLLNQL